MKKLILIILLVLPVFAQSQGIKRGQVGMPGITPTKSIGTGGIDQSDNVIPQTPFVTPYYQWLYTTISDGGVASWVDGVNSLDLTQATESKQPTKSSTGISFDGGDYIQNTSPANLGHSISVDMVLKITDTNAVDVQEIFDYKQGAGATITVLGLRLQTDAVTTFKKVGVGYFNGAAWTYKNYKTTDFPINTYFRLTITADSLGKQILYVNGSVVTPLSAAFTVGVNAAKVIMGCSADSETWFFTGGIKAYFMYDKVLSAEEIIQNGTAFTERGYY